MSSIILKVIRNLSMVGYKLLLQAAKSLFDRGELNLIIVNHPDKILLISFHIFI